jgi:biotin carboxyl carrier protein
VGEFAELIAAVTHGARRIKAANTAPLAYGAACMKPRGVFCFSSRILGTIPKVGSLRWALCPPRSGASTLTLVPLFCKLRERMRYATTVNGKSFEIDIDQDGKITVNGEERHIDFKSISESLYSVIIENASFEVVVEQRDGQYHVLMQGDMYEVEVLDERQQRLARATSGFGVAQGEINLKSPMPGLIVDVRVQERRARPIADRVGVDEDGERTEGTPRGYGHPCAYRQGG